MARIQDDEAEVTFIARTQHAHEGRLADPMRQTLAGAAATDGIRAIDFMSLSSADRRLVPAMSNALASSAPESIQISSGVP